MVVIPSDVVLLMPEVVVEGGGKVVSVLPISSHRAGGPGGGTHLASVSHTCLAKLKYNPGKHLCPRAIDSVPTQL